MKSKRELKETYKEMKHPIGVFQIRNILNNKIYIESSANLAAIWNRHKFQLNGGLHPNTSLQKEWNEFGQESFAFEILSEIKQDDGRAIEDYHKEAKQLEGLFMEELQPFGEQGYHAKKSK
jgi:hypothetical protein